MMAAGGRLARALFHLALADFRERTRRYSFLMMLGLVTYLGYTVNTGEFSLKLGDYQGINNSAWVGAQMTLVLTFIFSLFGFYLVKNSVERDIRTGVGQIIATTPLSRPAYLLGKWLSHFLLLGVMVVLLALAALVMQLLRHEAAVDAWALIAPFLFVALPCVAFVAGVAVFFEAVPFLRGGLGSVIFFFAWSFLLAMVVESALAAGPASGLLVDPLGMHTFIPPMQADLKAGHPDYTGGFSLSVSPGRVLKPFQWNGLAWTLPIIARQLLWPVIALGLVLIGSVFFERFDPARRRAGMSWRRSRPSAEPALPETLPPAPAPVVMPAALQLTPLASGSRQGTFFTILAAELRLLIKGWPWWWYLIAGGLIAACFFNPVAVIRAGLLPAAWIWPIVIWSGMGSREERFLTRQLVFAAPHSLARQLPAAWLAGAAVTAAAGAGAAAAFVLAGDAPALAGWLAGVVFIPSLALALGVWSGSNRLFEIVYLVWWYLGPVQRFAPLDFTSQTAYLLVGAILLTAAFAGRYARLRFA